MNHGSIDSGADTASVAGLADVPEDAPRDNGELVFDQPWQSRAFGLAVAANQAGYFAWSEFQQKLITEVAKLDASTGAVHTTAEPAGYYSCWLTALERLLAEKGLAPQQELAAKTAQYAARPPGHDHQHAH